MQKYKTTSRAPLLINSCEFDPVFPLEAQTKADEIMGNGQFAPGYERTYWEGCAHGFAVKGDMVGHSGVYTLGSTERCPQSDPKVKAGKEGAFKATVDFFKKCL